MKKLERQTKMCGNRHDGQTASEEPRPVTLVEDILMILKLNTAGCEAYETPDVKGKEGWSLSGFSRPWPKFFLPYPGTHSAQAQSPF